MLEDRFNQRYGRTIFVFADPPASEVDDLPTFWLGMRSMEKQHAESTTIDTSPQDVPVTISTRSPIQFCPWCGKRLMRFYFKKYTNIYDEEITKEFNRF